MKQQNLGVTGGLGVGLLMILCPWVYRLPIERDLTVAAQTKLQEKNLGHWRVSFSGLYATLQGPVAEGSLAQQIVEEVPGVAKVILQPGESLPSPTPAATPATPSPAATPAPLPPGKEVSEASRMETGLVQILHHNNQIYVRGLYADVPTRQAILSGVRKAFPKAQVLDETTPAEGDAMGWPQEVGTILPLLRSVGDLELSAGGDALILGGVVSSAKERERLEAAVQGHLPLGVTLENQLRLVGPRSAEPLVPTVPEGDPKGHRQEQATLNRVVLSGELLFGTASSRLPENAYAYLDRIATLLGTGSQAMVLISGHTDNQGDADTNRRLSQKRADAVRVYLITRGISVKRLFAKGYGSAQPLASNDTELNRRRNRRITFDIR